MLIRRGKKLLRIKLTWTKTLRNQKPRYFTLPELPGSHLCPVKAFKEYITYKENFHKHVGDGVNILYADGHVTRSLQLIVGQN